MEEKEKKTKSNRDSSVRAVDFKNVSDVNDAQQSKHIIESQSRYISILEDMIDDLKKEHEKELDLIYATRSWKVTKPIRVIGDGIKSIPGYRNLQKTYGYYKRCGFKATLKKVMHSRTFKGSEFPSPVSAEYRAQRAAVFENPVCFSVVVPLYNTPEKFLREMIQSVINQTYEKWELCLADGSDDGHGYVGQICSSFVSADSRIKYVKIENKGISENTNAAIQISTGDYIALLDHDDLLHPFALFENMQAVSSLNADFLYSDEVTFNVVPKDAYQPNFKPDFAPDTLRSYNYICHLTVFKRSFIDKIGYFNPECDGSQDYDMILRITEKAEKIVHIPKLLYYWRASTGSTAQDIGAKKYVIDAAKVALENHMERLGLEGVVLDARVPSVYRIKYTINGNPLVSIIIPNCDHVTTLRKCIDSIQEKTTYRNYEIVIVENNSSEDSIFRYYKELESKPNIKVVAWSGMFNYSAINNYGAGFASGEYFVLLNNDITIISDNWIEEMLMHAQRDGIGAVGAMLYYPTDKIQHAGVILGIGGVAGHSHKCFPRNDYGYMSRLCAIQNYSAVTAACMMVPRSVYEELDGLDESFMVAFNDVDFCLRIRKAGYLIVWTPYAEFYHYESESRGEEDTPMKRARFKSETDRFIERWGDVLEAGDPYYNPNLTLDSEDFSCRNN